jgi:hypothetical protein
MDTAQNHPFPWSLYLVGQFHYGVFDLNGHRLALLSNKEEANQLVAINNEVANRLQRTAEAMPAMLACLDAGVPIRKCVCPGCSLFREMIAENKRVGVLR